MPKLAIVDDNDEIRELLSAFLVTDGHQIRPFSSGEEFLDSFGRDAFDLVFLDIMLPGIDGITVLRRIREDSDVPVVMLTAKDSDGDYCQGLALGADDYVTKPFKAHLLTAKVRALLRRAAMAPAVRVKEAALQVGDLSYCPESHRLTVAGRPVPLTPQEERLLSFYMSHPNQILTREIIISNVWRLPSDKGQSRALDEANRRLRNKLVENGATTYVRTVWGIGFELSGGGRENA